MSKYGVGLVLTVALAANASARPADLCDPPPQLPSASNPSGSLSCFDLGTGHACFVEPSGYWYKWSGSGAVTLDEEQGLSDDDDVMAFCHTAGPGSVSVSVYALRNSKHVGCVRSEDDLVMIGSDTRQVQCDDPNGGSGGPDGM